jgi:PAS domain S-box-containing protein
MSKALGWSRNPSAALRYAAAVVSVGSATILALLVEHHWESSPAVSLLLVAIMFSAWLGGAWPGLLAVIVSVLTFDYYFLQPLHSLSVTANELPRLIIFAAAAVLLWLLAAAQCRAAESLRRARNDLAATAETMRKANEALRAENAHRMQAEGMLREHASLLDLTHDTVFVRDMNDVITYWNRDAAERYGWTRQEVLGKVSHQLLQTIFPVPIEEIKAELLRVDRWEGELIHTRRDGTPIVVASRWALQRDQAGKPAAILETNNDVTERKRWRSLTEALPQLVWAATPDGACDYFSTQWTEYTGVPEADLLGWRWMEVLHPDDRANTRRLWGDSVAGRRHYDVEYRVRRHDGAYGWFKTRGTPIRDSAGRIIKWFGTCTDITESETRYRNIFQTVGVSIWEGDFSGIKGAIDALKNRGIQDFRQYLRTNPQFVQQAISMVRVVDVNDVTLKLFAAESKAELLASLHKVFLPETQEVFVGALIAIAEDRTSFEAETVLQTLKGERLTVLFTMTFPPPPAGFESVLVSVTDISERKLAEAERERLGQRLRQAEKMEAVGRLAGGIAHDFNNVLGGILAYGEMLFEEAPGDSPLKRYAQNVLTAANRGRELVEQILAYSRSQRGKRAPADIACVVAETLELVRGSLPANIRLDANAPQLPLVVVGDATQLHQVVMNLCSNAIQAMSDGGILRVALEAADLSVERALSHGALRPGRYVRLTIEDSGSGMDEATRSRIFEPFFTTKEIGRGTGLGLSLVYAIVTDLAGAIDVKSVLTQGSTFAIYLPLAEIALAVAAEAEGPLPRGNGERVLLVDDEAQLLAVTAEVLSRLGYEPVSFSDSHAALAAFEAAAGRFDVVVTDDLMPGLTGTELARVVRRRRPGLPVVLVSGYSGPLLTQQALAAGISELLTKPLQSREIATTLARVLRRAA